MKKRIVSIELLRILAMMMVVLLHYLSKGGLLVSLTEGFVPGAYIAWLLEAFAIVAVNVYMLISGYFLVESGFKLGRLAELICQVLFYSLLIPLVLMAVGILDPGQLTVYRLLQYLFPSQMVHYWFITAYVIMYLFAPVLAAGVKQLSQRQLGITILLLLGFFSVSKSVLPVQLEADNLGYDGLWFICVFLVAAYMRLYGIPFLQKGKRGALCYAGSCLLIYGLTMGVRFIYLKTGRLGNFIHAPYDYNHILNLFAAISLFYAFSNWKLSGEKRIGRVILRVAPYTLGVYLLHEHIELRYLWPGWLGATLQCSPWMLVLRAVCSVLLVFVIGILVDMARGALFGWVKKLGRTARTIQVYKLVFPLVLCLYPLRHIWFGVEWWDTGYNYGNFVNMNRMDPMWLSGTFLGNALGHLFTLLPGGGTMLGLNVYTGLFVSVLALMGYFFFTREVKLPAWIAFAGEFLAECLCWCPTALLYNYLTYTLFAAGCILLYMALMRSGRKAAVCYVLAGVCLGLNVLTRFPNLAEMGMIAAVWAMAVIRRQRPGKTIGQTLWCLLGYVLGLAAGIGIIAAFYGLEKYMGGIQRLLNMPSEASDYSLYSMIYSQAAGYGLTLYWMKYLLPVSAAGLLIYSVLPEKGKWLKHLLYGAGIAASLAYLLHRRMFSLDYYDKASVFQWAAIWLVIMIASGAAVILHRHFSEQDKLLCGMGILILLITPLGSNNHLYSAINNLFLAAPWSLWMIRRFLIWLPDRVSVKGKLHIKLQPLKILSVCLLCILTVQSVLFGATYVFAEAGGGKNMHTNIENNAILRGMKTDPQRAGILEEITEYVEQQGLTGQEVILYGWIPSLSYYLEMPCAITSWPDLPSYNGDVMQTDLEQIAEGIERRERRAPVLILNKEQGVYLQGGTEALESLGLSSEAAENYGADRKLQMLKDFADRYHYALTFENEKLMLFQAQQEAEAAR